MILLVDNYDSFTFNLRRYLVRLGQSVLVLWNDSPELDKALDECRAVILSPGPCGPAQAGRCLEMVSEHSGRLPILGVCLGHQVIFAAFGGKIVRAQQPIHGRGWDIEIKQRPIFSGVPSPSRFARYHSLVADAASLPICLEVIAWSLPSGLENDIQPEIMAIAHKQHATFGVQFHPESILSDLGYQLLANFLDIAGLMRPDDLPSSDLLAASYAPRPTDDQQAWENSVVLPMRRGPLPSGLDFDLDGDGDLGSDGLAR